MRLLTFETGGRARLGVRRDESIVDVARVLPSAPGAWPAVFAAGALPDIARAVAEAPAKACVAAGSVRLLPPIPRPPKILCIGLNYRSHAEETGLPIPEYPIVFPRYPGSLVGAEAPLVRPTLSDCFDYEAELVAVVGRGGRAIPRERALEHVAGYTLCNEGSIRDYQFKTSQWAMGKNFDASGSMGPDIVTADELPPGAAGLRIQCRLNGETMQDGNTDDLIFDVTALIVELSAAMSLEPGDLIVTGTPPGVGFVRKPPVWLKSGDTCEIEIEGIGILRNPVIDEGTI
jgi:2-keto-4-pentenoate hydratase/2-oxohepta-3-ene-1,7-dioic acid hydratase in catechol pathway